MGRSWFMKGTQKVLKAKFFRSDNGNDPTREWLPDLDRADRRIIGTDIKDVEYSYPIGMPLCRPVRDGLLEVRSKISNGRIARILFFIAGNEMILLHGFIKKSQKTPKPDKDLALRRMKEHKKYG